MLRVHKRIIFCQSKIEMSPFSKIEMSPQQNKISTVLMHVHLLKDGGEGEVFGGGEAIVDADAIEGGAKEVEGGASSSRDRCR